MKFLVEIILLQMLFGNKKFAPQNDAKYFSDSHDHILIFRKTQRVFSN